MAGQKRLDVSDATGKLVGALAHPSNRGAFHVVIEGYNSTSKTLVPRTPAQDIRPEALIVPPDACTGLTNFVSALEAAVKHMDAIASLPGTWLPSVVVMLTDGHFNTGGKPETIATAIKARATLVCVGFGGDADMTMLSSLATSPTHAIQASNAGDLRRYFATIGQTASLAALTGQSVAELLGPALTRSKKS
ncbi:MAG: VWA domain-containing protein [Myxococcales bacterium]|nr:VWA domain-containing protein [Myxococcales bacterium]